MDKKDKTLGHLLTLKKHTIWFEITAIAAFLFLSLYGYLAGTDTTYYLFGATFILLFCAYVSRLCLGKRYIRVKLEDLSEQKCEDRVQIFERGLSGHYFRKLAAFAGFTGGYSLAETSGFGWTLAGACIVWVAFMFWFFIHVYMVKSMDDVLFFDAQKSVVEPKPDSPPHSTADETHLSLMEIDKQQYTEPDENRKINSEMCQLIDISKLREN